MNFKLLARVLGLLLMMESLALLACTLFSFFEAGWESSASRALATATLTALCLGLLLVLVGRGKYERIPRREGVLIVGAGWMTSTLIGSIPFVLSEPGLSPAAAFFESASGLTTTGSTVISDLYAWPKGVLLWRAVSQWLGGLGILVLFVALLASLGAGTKSLFRNESSFEASETSHAKIRDTALLLWKLYLVMTVVCLLGLRALGMTWFDAVSHAFTCMSTGGFSNHNASIGYFSTWETGLAIELWLMFFMLLGSISFLVYVVILRRNWKRLRNEEEAKWYLIFILVAIVSIVAIKFVLGGRELWASLRGASFTVVSIVSSTGYGTEDFEQWPVGAHFIVLGLMLMGGCAGSTAGGAKVSRILLLVRAVHQEIVQAFRPNQVFRLQVNGNSINSQSRSQTVLFVALFWFIAIVSMMVVSVLETTNGVDFETTVAAVLTTLSNIGPGFGAVGPTDNFSHFGDATLVYLALLMVMGRLEIFAFLVLFVPAAWRRF
ncbi:TrkH family potassium uptake protein [Roseibacillus ishigakijimensis]|uniref:TrkH family potassium uptake protein n=1 Tax=Roseibacillus ishigakijimensis TaxID=454146 RepID=A0A934VNQ7_9BACT|nr:TrkH family potassium uptake protein [Roseibacillus ishigakijimensis]MBK1835280.1 TrkH family potassium uptake protein [Roseibacillus ishigakijimensis]